jgi:hypothetical protein
MICAIFLRRRFVTTQGDRPAAVTGAPPTTLVIDAARQLLRPEQLTAMYQ